MLKTALSLLTYPRFTYKEYLDEYPTNILGEARSVLRDAASFNKPVIERYLKGEFKVPLQYSDGKVVPFDGGDERKFYMSMLVPIFRWILAAGAGYLLFGVVGMLLLSLPVIAIHAHHRTVALSAAQHLDVASAVRIVQITVDDMELRKKQ